MNAWPNAVRTALAGATLGILCLGPVALAATGPVSSTLAKGTLNTQVWQVLGQDSSMSLTKHPGWLTIATEHAPVAQFATTLHDMVLQTVAPSADWTVSVETTFFGTKFGPAGTLPNYQGGAIYAWQDDNNWVRMIRQVSNCTLGVQIDVGSWGSQTGIETPAGQPVATGTTTANGTAGTPAYDVACNNNDDPLWLRLTKQGDLFTGYYSTDGKNWVETQSFKDTTISVKDVGVNAGEGGGTATPTDMGFKDFTVGSTPTAATNTATQPAANTATQPAASLPQTGGGPLLPVVGATLAAIGAGLLVRRRPARLTRG